MQALKTGILNDARMLLHKSKKSHPEKPQRVESIMKALQSSGYLDHPKIDFVSSIERKATDEELGLVYPAKYIKYIANLWPKQSHRRDLTVLDTYFCEHSEEASRLAVGACLEGADNIMHQKWNNAFAIVRPPGHHSGARNTLNGFCVFNNVAITARYLQKKYGVKKIVILDWDIHCGDGTHQVFAADPSVLFISIHRYDHGHYYPSGDIGSFESSGRDEGEGFNVNLPLNFIDKNFKPYPTQSPGDNEYIYLYHRIVEPILKEFEPDFILVSSGFDASRFDPLGGFTVTPNGFYYMAKRLATLRIPMLVALQGGYNVEETGLDSVAVVKGLLEESQFPQPLPNIFLENVSEACCLHQNYHKDIDQIIEFHSKSWKCLQAPELVQFTNKIKINQKKMFGIVKKPDEESSSSSSSEKSEGEEETKQQSREVEEDPNRSKSEKKPKQSLQENKPPSQQEKSEMAISKPESDEEGTNQFYFVVGHMQRFKNFSVNNPQLLKWAYEQQTKFYQSNFPETKFAPQYFGKEGEYIILQNLLYQQKEHMVADFKMSRHSKRPGISAHRAQKEKKKEESSTSGKYGFRLCGFTTPTYKQGGLLVTDEAFIGKVLKKMVSAQNKGQFCDFLQNLAKTLRGVNRKYYNSSIILSRSKQKSEIRWIDFHYWFDNCSSYDEDLVQGLDNLRHFIEQVDTTTP